MTTYTAVQTRFQAGVEVTAGSIASTFADTAEEAAEELTEYLDRNPSRRAYLNGPQGWAAAGYPMIVDSDTSRIIVRPWTEFEAVCFKQRTTGKIVWAQGYKYPSGARGLIVEDMGVYHFYLSQQEYGEQVQALRTAMETLGFMEGESFRS